MSHREMCAQRGMENVHAASRTPQSTLFIARPRHAGHPSYVFVCLGTHTGRKRRFREEAKYVTKGPNTTTKFIQDDDPERPTK